jgi:hypothetical protein
MKHVAVPFLCSLQSIWQRHRTLVQSPKKEKQQEGWLVGSFETRFQLGLHQGKVKIYLVWS